MLTRRQCLLMLPLLLPALTNASSPLQQAMQRARAMRDEAVRSGDQSFGAVVLRGGQIVGEAPSRVVTAGDPTAHAEMEAIRDAAHRLTLNQQTRIVSAERYADDRAEVIALWNSLVACYYPVEAE